MDADDDEGDDDDEEGRAAALLGELEDLEEEQELMLAVLKELGANFIERLSQSLLGVQRQHFGLNSAFFREDPSETSHPPACGRTSVSTQAKSERSSRRSGSRGATC